jgi:hypothetical protein
MAVEETGVAVILSLFEEEGQAEPYAHAMIEPADAVAIATKFMAAAMQAAALESEIQALPPDDRQAGIQSLLERMSSGLN